MKRATIAGLAVLAIATVIMRGAIVSPGGYQDWVQQWKIQPSDHANADSVHFGIERSRPNNHWSSSKDVPFSRFQGLSRDTLTRGGAVKFEYVHDAGRLICLGNVANGGGAGTFTFVENPQYGAELRRLGYDAPDPDRIFEMVALDISLDYARSVRAEFSSATLKQLIEMSIHGVSLDYIRSIHQAGYRDLTIPDFVEMRIHGVSTDFIHDLQSAGYNVPAKKIVEMRIHGVSSDYIRTLKSQGLDATADQLVELRIHGVSTEFINETRSMGFRFTTKELVELRIHGVDGAYLRKLQDSGFKNLSADQITRLRIHGVD